MSYVAWREELATGIEAIDHDHKALFDLVDQFHEAYVGNHGGDALEAVFVTLIDYTGYHFAREEELMRRIGFPGQEDHTKAHEALRSEVMALHARYLRDERRGEEKDLGLEMLAFLSNWLHFHIAEEDMEYRDFMRGA